jgi:hypothetical protein
MRRRSAQVGDLPQCRYTSGIGHARVRSDALVHCPGGPTGWSRSGRRCWPRPAAGGHRPIAAALGLPRDTVRGWLRRARERAGWLHALVMRRAFEADPVLGPVVPRRSRLADAVEALGLAVAALSRRSGVLAGSPWPVIAALTGGRLLAPLRSG